MLQAMHESEMNLWRISQENPADFNFSNDHGASARRGGTTPNGSAVSMQHNQHNRKASKLKRPTSFGNRLSSQNTPSGN